MKHIQTGKLGEQYAQDALVELGFTILNTNWRFKHCEVDIIAQKDDSIHFVEVKTRRNTKYGNPEEAVSINKMRCLKIAAEEWQLQNPEWKKVQFDVIAILLNEKDIHNLHINWDVYF